MKSDNEIKITRLEDYKAPLFLIRKVSLHFVLSESSTEVSSRLHVVRNGEHNEALHLDGEDLELLEIRLDSEILTESDYRLDDESLRIENLPNEFILFIKNRIDPASNTRLEGLYVSKGIYCTQCEAEGFRRITYFIDRPDVMSLYDVTIEASEDFSVVLSNGNLVSDEIKGGRRICHWEDPHAKPCYLFALVAGKLSSISDTFTTMSGIEVDLNIYLSAGYEERALYAMGALKRAMLWDEERFGLEYDLGIFNIVAIDDFNMGAMENKSLNIFNSKYVLADFRTATDMDYMFIESIIGHEYFHNWSGNRVTCRDWFQLSLKEGLTVFRDQEFSGDENSRSVVRIMDVMQLRSAQFPEDAGSLSHAVRPLEYAEINNFYTATVYEKGAELVRMLHSLLGEAGFCRGLSLYFARYDGQAVTCDDFVDSMRAANGMEQKDIEQKDFEILKDFETWYSQSGTPRINYETSYDESNRLYRIRIRQRTEPTADSDEKRPLPVPLQFALLDESGIEQKLHCESGNLRHVEGRDFFYLTEAEHEFTFSDIVVEPHLSLNRNFSAPVIIETRQSESQLAFHMGHDSDSYLRWEAGQNYALKILQELIGNLNYDIGKNHSGYSEAFSRMLETAHEDRAFSVLLLSIPSESIIGDNQEIVDVEAIHLARKRLQVFLGEMFCDEWTSLYESLKSDEAYEPDLRQIGQRALRNLSLSYRSANGATAIAESHYFSSDNMTDKIAALEILAHAKKEFRQKAFDNFYGSFKDDDIVLDKWFSLQGRSYAEDALVNIKQLSQHRDFNIRNPNRLRSLVGSFAFGNAVKFHSANGEGYNFVLNILQELDALNPQTCARLLGAFTSCERLKSPMPAIASNCLESFREATILSKDSSEIVGKMLDKR